ncbi:MAG: hypothetical protein GX202_08700 [Firmicutes bacterium]|nr:hypothetical protein [Bacillota bacterium]
MKRRRLFVGFMVVALIVCLSTTLFGASERRYAYSASNPGGVWYTMCGGIVKLLQEKLPANIRVDMIASGG